MPQYAILIYEKEIPLEEYPPEVMEANMAAGQRIEAIGAKIVGETALQPASKATTVHKGGVVTDGPFLETKEAFAGIFVIEAEDLDQAIAVARLLPIMEGGVEIRPLMETG
ncbi:YciI family protein [Spongiactinospora sp. TRM90649]|uniref:YciI family protein n=1 Tax=Spongiactinospora sp. TRM90649 TaxID=3031114 RepID=UPI0023F8D360|nr:YciI family protein [Spongiactinospora sp. TRM90649]MDF5751632.1 YciI family protein [Spongiactinospora sp. TRM90649]